MKVGGRTWWAAGLALCTLACAAHFPAPVTSQGSTAVSHEALLNVAKPQPKYAVAVLAEGYGSGDQATFDADVKRLLEDGVLLFTPFVDKNRLEFRKIPLVSQDVGVSTEHQTHDTPLGITFNGRQSDCYFTLSAATLTKISKEARSKGDVDYTVVLVNAVGASGVGCALKEKVAVVTRNAAAAVLVHELGHTIGDLYDEYSSAATDTSKVSSGNCTTETQAANSPWRDLFVGTVSVPSSLQSGPAVGMYEGCDHRVAKIYRPTKSCMMQTAKMNFCTVCRRILIDVLDTPRPASPTAGPPAAFVHLRLLVPPGRLSKPEVIDNWASNDGPPFGPLPLHGIWALMIGNDVLGAVGVTGDLPSWRAYNDAPLLPESEQYIRAPYQVVEIAIPRSRLKSHQDDIPELRLFSFGDRVQRSPSSIENIPADFPPATAIGRSQQLSSLVQSLLQ